MEKYCDNRSVGVVLTNQNGELALLTRGRFPIGIAPPAGHVDDHGSPEQAAVDEVSEELGVTLALDGLKRTTIMGRRVDNVCRRTGGDHHDWNVYEARVDADVALLPDAEETKGARWYSPSDVEALAERTRRYLVGAIPEDEWAANPGLEPVWVPFMQELGYVRE